MVGRRAGRLLECRLRLYGRDRRSRSRTGAAQWRPHARRHLVRRHPAELCREPAAWHRRRSGNHRARRTRPTPGNFLGPVTRRRRTRGRRIAGSGRRRRGSRRRLHAEPAGSDRRDAGYHEPRRNLVVVLPRLRHPRGARPLRPDRAESALHGGRLLLRRQDARFARTHRRHPRKPALGDVRGRGGERESTTRPRAAADGTSLLRVRPSGRDACASSDSRSTIRSTSSIHRAPRACRSASSTARAAPCCST